MSNKAEDGAMKSVEKRGSVPKLRFPEFWDAGVWEETPFQVIADPVSERATQGAENNVLSLSGEHGIVLQSEFFGKKVAGENSERYLKIVRNDFVYNDRTTKASTYGTIKRLSKYSGGIVSPIYKCFRFNANENPVFWEWYFESGIHDKQLSSLVNEGARAGRFNISISQFLSTAAWRPNEDEQQKIADCLASLDELITLEAQKLDTLKTHKKGLMQQLFPAEGETLPKLRFPEFDDVLKTVGFAELGEIKIGLTHKPEYIESGKPFLSSRNISNGYIDFENIKYISEEKFSNMPESTKPKVGDILFTRVGSNLGNPIILEEDREFGIFVSLGIFRVNKDVSNYYVKHWMNSDFFWEQVKQKVAGGAKDNLNTTWLKEFKLSIPSFAEQQKIADCFASLDNLITTQSQKLAALKTHKKGLMQQLFPSLPEVDA
jgi:type I restriction enzyme S subunit